MGSFNRKQLAAIAEATPGTFNTSVRSATYAQFLPLEPSMDFEFQTYDRTIQRASLTKPPPIAGQQRATVSFGHELTGHSDGSTVPPWDLFLRACGFPRVTIYKITIGAVTGGPFRHGETVTQGTSNATAKVFFDTYTGTTTLYVYSITGTPDNSHTWTGGTSAATADASTTETAAGYGWAPCDFPTATVTYSGSDPAAGEVVTGATSGAIGVIDSVDTSGNVLKIRVYNGLMYANAEALTASSTGAIGNSSSVALENMPTLSFALYEDSIRKEVSGARGNVRLSGEIGKPAILNFAFTGAFSSVADAINLTTPTTPYKTPPMLVGVTCLLGTEGAAPTYSPRFTAFELDAGHQVAYRESMAASSGILEAMIVDRNGTGSIDPEQDLEASYAFIGNWKDNAIGSLKMTIGSSVGNKFIVQVPGLRTTGVRGGQRDNIATYDCTFALTGGQMSNASNAVGERNDLLIGYITA